MSKSFVFSAVFSVLVALTFPAAAQNAPASEMPAGNAKTGDAKQPGAGAAAPVAVPVAPVGAYNVGVGPINLKPRAYVGATAASTTKAATASTLGANTNAKRLSFPVDNPNSAAAYNQRLVNTKIVAQKRKDSIIPSPFPDNF